MKRLLLYTLLCFSFWARSQDRVYLTNGEVRVAKVLEIAPDYIIIVPLSESGAPFVDANETIAKSLVLLIEFKGGHVEVFNQPQKTAVYNATGTMRKEAKDQGDLSFNFASLNTLALCNADISVFFERLNSSKKIGLGLMGAYNFNPYVIAPNLFLVPLHNAKKNYDLGGFVNFYPGHFRRRTTFYFGVLLKYTSFRFTKIEDQGSGPSTSIKYTPAKGKQMATIFTVGTHADLGGNFFFKTIAGIGGFRLNGDYKQQYNYILNRDRDPSERINSSFLPKFYFGFNIGFTF